MWIVGGSIATKGRGARSGLSATVVLISGEASPASPIMSPADALSISMRSIPRWEKSFVTRPVSGLPSGFKLATGSPILMLPEAIRPIEIRPTKSE